MSDPGDPDRATPHLGEGPAEAYDFADRDPRPTPPEDPTRQPEQALLGRPLLSIRTRIILAFALIFALCTVISVWTIYTVSRLQTQVRFLELADSYMSEIQQARRFEKNFLLYGTNLDDALEHVAKAQATLTTNRATMLKLVGARNLRIVNSHVADYQALLDRLGRAGSPEKAAEIEPDLRQHGAEMVAFGMELARSERDSVEKTFFLAKRVPFVFLGVLLVMILVVSTFLSRQLLASLKRFTAYADRIGAGDFSPITPVRKYRDEFSQLGLAFNHMIAELDRRHDILVESHKLRAIGNLVAGVAHELNNPLNNIFLTASSMLEDYPELDDDEKLDMAADVMKEAERSQHIVRNLLDFARQSETKIEPIHLDEVLQKSTSLVANQVKLAKIRLALDAPPGLPPIHGDAQLLTQVFVNLILNAVDATPERGHIGVSVRTDVEKGYLAVMVADSGHGIPEHVLGRIFEPFFTTKKEGKGTGLGLSVSRGWIRKMGGTIRVKSVQGKGTTFTVLLPTTDIPFEALAAHGNPDDTLA